MQKEACWASDFVMHSQVYFKDKDMALKEVNLHD